MVAFCLLGLRWVGASQAQLSLWPPPTQKQELPNRAVSRSSGWPGTHYIAKAGLHRHNRVVQSRRSNH